MKIRSWLTPAALIVALTTVVLAEDSKAIKLDDIKCPISGKKVKAESKVDYKDGSLFFCCDGCPDAFKKDQAKYSTKANHQLVATKQAKQVNCPLGGKPHKESISVKVDGVEVGVCCNGCKGKLEKATDEEKLAMAFSDKAFDKAFKVKKAEKK